ncbi:unnamed protein product [Rhizophagus irregularis]|nr:unnamed protein product [Rhizophagus irregularis]CAB4415774.1 unnamed protein product [Rhizophagus irregularis]
MVKTSRKTSRKANLRQVIRPNLGKKVNLRSNIQQSLVNHNFNTTTTDIQNNSINSFSSQRFEQIDESSNLTLPSSPSLPSPPSPSPPSPSPPSLSPPSQSLQHENDNLAAEDNQENYSYDIDENYYWESESDDNNDGNYSWKFSEDSDSDNQENYSDGSDEEISFTFKDQYDGFQDTPSYSSEAGPYFPNKTVMLMFIWYTKHMIGTHAYQDLIKILKHPDFRISELPFSITTLKKMRRGLPLMTLNSHDRILKNPFLFSKMYFGPGVEASEVVELWEGQIWKESPIFGETSLLINNVLYQAGDFIIYIIYQERSSTLHLGQINGIVTKENKDEKFLYIQEIVYYSDLPKNLKSYERLNKSKKSTVWLTERRNLVNISNVINHVKIWLKDLPEPLNYDYQIDEILYVHNNRSKIRQITRRHRLTYYKTPTPPSSIQHLKFFVDLYYDDFGFVPFGATFTEFIKPFIHDMRKLQDGIIMTNCHGEEVFISGGLGMCTADLPQGNDLTGIRRHNAYYGCRSCEVSQDDLTNLLFDIQANGRYCHLTDYQFQMIKQAPTKSSKETIAKQHGLRYHKNILDHLIRNRHIQTPQDPYHCLAGLVRRLFDETFKVMNNTGYVEFIKVWKTFEVPSIWNRLQNPITHRDSYWMNDSLRLTMIMPFILIRAINYKHYKDDFITRIKNDFCLSNKMQVPGIIVNCWVKMAKACKAIFKSSYIIDESYNDYIALSEILEEISNMLLKVFGLSFSKLPNMHVLRHLPEIAVNFGTMVNVSVAFKEAMHGLYKKHVPHTNKKNISMDLSKRDNTLQTLRYLLDGGLDERYDNIVNNSFSNIGQDPHLCGLLNDWYIKTSNSKEENTGIFSIHPDFGNIRVYGLWKLSKIHKLGLSSTISENNLLFDLTKIYEDIYQNYGIIIQRHINYYDFIYFTVLHENYYSNITLRVGEVIDVEEDDNSNEQSYALIRAIILHQDDYGRINPFLLVDWFYRSGNVDSITGLPIYYLQESNDSLWSHLHPLIIVDRQPKVHFVHKCTRNCLGGSHDKNNKEYILNEFYYLII